MCIQATTEEARQTDNATSGGYDITMLSLLAETIQVRRHGAAYLCY